MKDKMCKYLRNATPVTRVATSSDPATAPSARKNEYMVIVVRKRMSKAKKN